MSLTPTTLRNDLKCGKGAISKGEKCTKGPATKAKPKASNTIRNVALGVGGAALLGGAALATKRGLAARRLAAKPTGDTPAARKAQIKSVFTEAKGMGLGVSIAGAGLSAAGAGLIANEASKDWRQRSAAAQLAGGLLLYTGTGTVVAGSNMRRNLRSAEAQFSAREADYTQAWNAARARARQREAENKASGSRGSRNLGANKAVPNPFKDLGVSERASDAEIKKQWLKLMRQNHPDVGGDPRKAQQINAAYQEVMRRRGKLDSMYADGFDLDLDDLGLWN